MIDMADASQPPQPPPVSQQLGGLFKWLKENKGPVMLLIMQYLLMGVMGKLDLVVIVLLCLPVLVFREIYVTLFGKDG